MKIELFIFVLWTTRFDFVNVKKMMEAQVLRYCNVLFLFNQ